MIPRALPRWAWFMLAWLCASAGAAPAVPAGEAAPLANEPLLEARVVHLAEGLRCLVCQNQTVADSQAGLAVDLKNQIREQLRIGRSEAEVIDFMVQRYGDFVLYKPPFKASTALLWYGPFAMLALGSAIAVLAVRRRRPRADAAGLTIEQRLRAVALLADDLEDPS